MNDQDKEALELILSKNLTALTESDKGFLRARVSYLNATQLETYADILDAGTPVELTDMNLKELKAHAASLGVDITGLTKLADIVAAIEAHNAK